MKPAKAWRVTVLFGVYRSRLEALIVIMLNFLLSLSNDRHRYPADVAPHCWSNIYAESALAKKPLYLWEK